MSKKPEQRHDRDGILEDSNDEAEPRTTLSQLLDERRADAEEKKTREDRESYMEMMTAFLRRPISAAEFERVELGRPFGRRKK